MRRSFIQGASTCDASGFLDLGPGRPSGLWSCCPLRRFPLWVVAPENLHRSKKKGLVNVEGVSRHGKLAKRDREEKVEGRCVQNMCSLYWFHIFRGKMKLRQNRSMITHFPNFFEAHGLWTKTEFGLPTQVLQQSGEFYEERTM